MGDIMDRDKLAEKIQQSWYGQDGINEDSDKTNNGIPADLPIDFIVNLRQKGYTITKVLDAGAFNVTSNKSDLKNNTLNDGEESIEMDNNDLLLKLVEKVEESNKQLKSDIVESEKRNASDRKEREERIEEQRKLSEERMEKKFNEAMEAIKYQNEKIDKLGDKLGDKIDKLDTKLDTKVSQLELKVTENNKYVRNISITTMLSIAAMVISVVAMAIKILLSK